ncbi:ABC transporter permease [uncultured Proteiniphilum sp.]|uniref:ABC transporter permease n=1 Tax=uncultured Proteiniphilum sp. TaxID=497637 RepID=UPI002638E62F|nr:ABC transporter permease [uncultured Proteiniphilum sp.]
MNITVIFRRLVKSRSLRIVNLLGLTVIFACLLLSYQYIRKELSYDRFNENADRIVRLSIQYDDEPLDGRLYLQNVESELEKIAEIEQFVFISKVNTAVLTYAGERRIMNDFYAVSLNFFEVFSYSLAVGDPSTVLKSPESILVSHSLAQELFGNENPLGKELSLEGRRMDSKTYFVSGVFDDFPENSHFHTDLLFHRRHDVPEWTYVYLLLNDKDDIPQVKKQVEAHYDAFENLTEKVTAHLMPLTDIHLHSRAQREMEHNGNIYYIYLITGANILLLVVVLFNLWLNHSLLFSYNKRYYQLLRLNGANASTIFYNEAIPAFLIGLLSILLGGMAAHYLSPVLDFQIVPFISPGTLWLTFGFLTVVLLVSLIPALASISSTLFISTRNSLNPTCFSFANIRYMLVVQYAIVIFIVIISFGISKQLNLIKTTQVGGKTENILVMEEQPDDVKERYELLKTELLKYSEIEQVTTAFQLPGTAIRDGVRVTVEGKSEPVPLPILLVGEDFFSFFGIRTIAGTVFDPYKMTYKEESDILMDHLNGKEIPTDLTEQYMLNRKASSILGFNSPEEAIGKNIQISQGTLDYISKGTICGITDDFTYINIYEESIPLIIMQRQLFRHCFMLKFAPDKQEEGLKIFNDVWNKVNPDYPSNYSFLQDVYGKVYRNEFNAGRLVNLFSLLCLIIANLGLIIFMAFIIKRRRKEIAIRKVNGARPGQIIRMLNMSFIFRIIIAFVIACPLAWWVMQQWLANFAHKTTPDWWIFLLAGIAVLLLSAAAVSWQSWRASVQNPADVVKSE